LVCPNDPEIIVERIVHLIQDPNIAVKMRNNERRFVFETFFIRQYVISFQKMVQEAMD